MLRKLHFWAPKPHLLDRFILRQLDNKHCSLFKLRPETPVIMRTLPSPLPPGGMVCTPSGAKPHKLFGERSLSFEPKAAPGLACERTHDQTHAAAIPSSSNWGAKCAPIRKITQETTREIRVRPRPRRRFFVRSEMAPIIWGENVSPKA
jgi:hypothetical protein